MVDIEKLEDLPYRENRKTYLTNKFGNLYNIFDYKRRSNKEKDPYSIAFRVIDNNIGKSFDNAFKYYCTKVKKHEQYIFLNKFKQLSFYKYNNYFVDDNGNIQNDKYVKPKKPIILYSKDYEIQKVHIETGIRFDKFDPVYEKELKTKTWFDSLGNMRSHSWKENKFFLYYQYKHYKAQEKDFHNIIIKGSYTEFESKQDPNYKKLMAEYIKSSKKSWNEKYKIPKLSDKEFRAILRAKQLKQKEETRIKLEAKGFRKQAFTNHV